MDGQTMFCFVMRKLWYPFCNAWPSDRQNKVMPESMVLWRFLHELLPTCVFALGAIAFVRMLVGACRGACRRSLRPVLSSIPCVYMLGMVCVVAIGESNLRYGLISTFLMAYYALEAITAISTASGSDGGFCQRIRLSGVYSKSAPIFASHSGGSNCAFPPEGENVISPNR